MASNQNPELSDMSCAAAQKRPEREYAPPTVKLIETLRELTRSSEPPGNTDGITFIQPS
jgi:hypothetical protein